jgi:hypothetical protein
MLECGRVKTHPIKTLTAQFDSSISSLLFTTISLNNPNWSESHSITLLLTIIDKCTPFRADVNWPITPSKKHNLKNECANAMTKDDSQQEGAQ